MAGTSSATAASMENARGCAECMSSRLPAELPAMIQGTPDAAEPPDLRTSSFLERLHAAAQRQRFLAVRRASIPIQCRPARRAMPATGCRVSGRHRRCHARPGVLLQAQPRVLRSAGLARPARAAGACCDADAGRDPGARSTPSAATRPRPCGRTPAPSSTISTPTRSRVNPYHGRRLARAVLRLRRPRRVRAVQDQQSRRAARSRTCWSKAPSRCSCTSRGGR